jgi:hypothetical protein
MQDDTIGLIKNVVTKQRIQRRLAVEDGTPSGRRVSELVLVQNIRVGTLKFASSHVMRINVLQKISMVLKERVKLVECKPES